MVWVQAQPMIHVSRKFKSDLSLSQWAGAHGISFTSLQHDELTSYSFSFESPSKHVAVYTQNTTVYDWQFIQRPYGQQLPFHFHCDVILCNVDIKETHFCIIAADKPLEWAKNEDVAALRCFPRQLQLHCRSTWCSTGRHGSANGGISLRDWGDASTNTLFALILYEKSPSNGIRGRMATLTVY